jgi:hypothetical protein
MIGALAGVRPHRQPAADDLAQAGDVRVKLPVSLGPAKRHPEAGHHFVQDEQRAILTAQIVQA